MSLLVRLLATMSMAGTFLAAAPTTAVASETATGPAAHSDVRVHRTSNGGFDRAYLIRTSRWVIRDMKTVDYRLTDGISVSSGLYVLSGSFGYMSNAGVPPNIRNQARFKARISTLSDFAEMAGDEYYDDEISALARYSVIKDQTRILFRQINAALGTSLQVPS